MCAPIPEGKWAWKYNACIECGTTGIKHKGRGLCLRCFDKDRNKKPARELQQRKNSRRYIEKHKHTEEFKESSRKRARKYWQKNKDNPEYREKIRRQQRESHHRLKDTPERKAAIKVWQRRRYLRTYYGKFLDGNKFYLKKYRGGLIIACEGCDKHCRIASPIKIPTHGKFNQMNELKLFKKLVIKRCKLSAVAQR